jgi:GH24 family phage-related lysozyme (muramidase)
LNPLPWKPSLAAAQYDWRELANTGGVHAAEYYRQLTVARLEFASIVALFDHDMAIAESGIRTWLVERYALEVQIVLRDMVFNLGAARMSKYIKLRAALDRADYPMAADECHRNGVQSARNEACRKLILSCRT